MSMPAAISAYKSKSQTSMTKAVESCLSIQAKRHADIVIRVNHSIKRKSFLTKTKVNGDLAYTSNENIKRHIQLKEKGKPEKNGSESTARR